MGREVVHGYDSDEFKPEENDPGGNTAIEFPGSESRVRAPIGNLNIAENRGINRV